MILKYKGRFHHLLQKWKDVLHKQKYTLCFGNCNGIGLHADLENSKHHPPIRNHIDESMVMKDIMIETEKQLPCVAGQGPQLKYGDLRNG